MVWSDSYQKPVLFRAHSINLPEDDALLWKHFWKSKTIISMETRGVPGGAAALTRSRKSTPRVSLRKRRPSLPQAFRMVWKLCLQFPWEHKTPPVTDPLADLWHWAGATGMELFQHNWNNEGWNKKAPYALGPLNKLSWELAQWDRECCLSLCVSDSQPIGLAAR